MVVLYEVFEYSTLNNQNSNVLSPTTSPIVFKFCKIGQVLKLSGSFYCTVRLYLEYTLPYLSSRTGKR